MAEKYLWKATCVYDARMCPTRNDSVLFLIALYNSESLWSNHDISLLHENQQLKFIIHLPNSSKRTHEESEQHKQEKAVLLIKEKNYLVTKPSGWKKIWFAFRALI